MPECRRWPRISGVAYTLDPTITPKMDGDTINPGSAYSGEELSEVFQNESLVGKRGRILRAASGFPRRRRDGRVPCSAGHTPAYISPYGDVFPCVQFPSAERQRAAAEIHRYLEPLPGAERGSLDSGQGSCRLLLLQPRRELHALSRAGVHGREYARAFDGGLREVVPSDRDSLGQYAAPGVF